MRPLYLHGDPPLRVHLDGPALRVTTKRRAARLYPFRLLSRITVSGHVDWNTAALLACVDHGIPVTFLDRNGEVRAWCLGATVRRLPLVQQLVLFLDRPDWKAHYQAWRDAMERRSVLNLLHRLGTASPDLRAGRVREQVLRQAHKLAWPDRVTVVESRMNGLLGAHLARLFMQAGIGPDALFLEPSGLNLLSDLQAILAWDLWYETLHLLARASDSGADAVDGDENRLSYLIASVYEQRAPRTEKLFRQLLYALERRLREVER